MQEKNGWQELMNAPFFKHIYTSSDPVQGYKAAAQLLKTIDECLFSQGTSFDQTNAMFNIPGNQWFKETVGFNATAMLKILQTVPQSANEEFFNMPDGAWLKKYVEDARFCNYINNLLDFVMAQARNGLDEGPDIPPLEVRRKETARENNIETTHTATTARNIAEEAKEAADKARQTAESIMPNMLTTLGIFIAIVIAVVACYLSLLLTQLGENPLPLSMSMILLMGHILLNIIFLLLYLISKMSSHTLACNCPVGNKMDCAECDKALRESCHWGNKLWLRYPYVVLLNGSCILAYCGFALWNIINAYIGEDITGALKGNWRWTLTVAAVLATVSIASICLASWLCFFRNPAKKGKSEERKQKRREQKQEKREQKQKKKQYKIDCKKLEELQRTLDEQKRQLETQQQLIGELSVRIDSLVNATEHSSVR